MSLWTPDDLRKGTSGQLLQKGTRLLNGVGTDTRDNLNEKIFFALKGDNFDAHEFISQATKQGVGAVVIHQDIPDIPKEITVVKVDDTLKALQRFGHFHRKNWTGTLVGLTGSNGKTTTKEFCATILGQKFPVLSTKGNLNNHIGVPLTLLELRQEHKYAVIEMGMNHAGEIRELTEIADPDIVLVTNVGKAHIEFLGSIENIARAKEEIYEAARPNATRIYNLDNSYTATMRARAPGGCKVLTWSSYDRDVDVSFKEKLFTLDYIEIHGLIKKDPGSVKMKIFGRQQVANASAAACVALACGLEPQLIWKGLSLCKSTWGRGQIIELENGARVLFDAYNANPDSFELALENFSKIAVRGKKYIVCGDMLELGDLSESAHEQLGSKIAEVQPEAVLAVGAQSGAVERGLKAAGFKNKIVISNTYEEKLATSFGTVLQTGDMVLVKGSRGMKLERVVQAWRPLNFEAKH